MRAAAVRPADVRPEPFPWGTALHFGFGLLRLPPNVFWGLTLKELTALGGALRPPDGIDRAALAALMRRWPDGGQDGT